MKPAISSSGQFNRRRVRSPARGAAFRPGAVVIDHHGTLEPVGFVEPVNDIFSRPVAMRDLLLGLDLAHKQRGLEVALRDAVREGRLKPGDALPSSRVLAADLGVGRATVVAAYDQLIAEGYLMSRPGALTRVAPGQWATDQPTAVRVQPDYRFDLIPGEPDVSQFPRAAWLRCTRAVLASAPNELLGYGDHAGLVELRDVLANHLNRTRNAAATAESTIVVPGTSSGLAQVARMLHRHGANAIAIEEPGFPFHHPILRREGLELIPVPVDAEGIDLQALAATGVTAALVTPAHQYPFGTVMSAQRRTGLVGWARQNRAWIVEDDYDGEFRYDRQPLGALHGIAPDRVVYLGTTSKTLGPGLRVGWIVLPPELRGPMTDQRGRDSEVSHLTQATLARFIAQGDLDRHVRRLRSLYRTRRDQLIDTLNTAIDYPDIRGVAAGLHLTIVLPEHIDEGTVVRQARDEHRLALWGLRQHYLTDNTVGGVVLGYSRTPTDFRQSLIHLADVLRQHHHE
jgi:GntR family transcriptional regulator / MocR family aminotransferase